MVDRSSEHRVHNYNSQTGPTKYLQYCKIEDRKKNYASNCFNINMCSLTKNINGREAIFCKFKILKKAHAIKACLNINL